MTGRKRVPAYLPELVSINVETQELANPRGCWGMKLRMSRATKSRLRRMLKNDTRYFRMLADNRLLRQFLISFFALLLIVSLNSMQFGVTQWAMAWVKAVFTQDYDFAADLRNTKVLTVLKDVVNPAALARFWNTPPRVPRGTLVEMSWPVDGAVTSVFGWRVAPTEKGQRLHEGIDISAEMGTPIKSVADGTVIIVRESPSYGKMLEIDHGSGWQSVYAHCSEILVKPGGSVKRGEVVAKVGQTGDATAPHLHFEVKKDGQQVDPLAVLPSK